MSWIDCLFVTVNDKDLLLISLPELKALFRLFNAIDQPAPVSFQIGSYGLRFVLVHPAYPILA
jgi:hypothetical protein